MRRFSLVAVCLALVVVVFGAYVRLSDAGLGCPDWPGCYGEVLVPAEVVDAGFIGQSLDRWKAWKEMTHRYLAGILGIVILTMTVVLWAKKQTATGLRFLSAFILVFVVFQAILGMWTVTLLLKPAVVVAHLLGGVTILALLYWLFLCISDVRFVLYRGTGNLFLWAVAGIVVLFFQIALGGWVSSNYAGLVCPDFPHCQGAWWPAMNFSEGFRLWHDAEGLINYDGGILPADARMAIHVVHRLGALVTFCVFAVLAYKAVILDDPILRITGLIIFSLLCIQIFLGIANVLWYLPLSLALAHNAVAALLVLTMVHLLYRSWVVFKQGIK